MKITKFYDPAGEGGGAPATASKDSVLSVLAGIKKGFEDGLKKNAADQEKALDQKLDAVNQAIEELKAKKPDAVTADELKAVEANLAATVKGLEILAERVQKQGKTATGQTQQSQGATGNPSLAEHVLKGLESFKDNINHDRISKGMNEYKFVTKAVADMTIGNNLTGNFPATYRSGIVPQPFENIHLRDLVRVTPSATDSYHFYRHNVGEGAITWQGNESGTKAQIDEDLLEVTVNLDYLAGWLRISKKMLRNFTGLQSYLTTWLPEKYYQVEDTKGYQSLISQATGTQVTGVNIMDTLIKTIGAQKKARYNVTGIVVDGLVWANMLTYKGVTSGEYTMPQGVVTISPTGQLMICGIPVYTASWVGGDEAIIGDWKYFEIIQSEGLSLQFFEQDGTNVRENKITARIEASVGFAMLDPKAFVVASLESVS